MAQPALEGHHYSDAGRWHLSLWSATPSSTVRLSVSTDRAAAIPRIATRSARRSGVRCLRSVLARWSFDEPPYDAVVCRSLLLWKFEMAIVGERWIPHD